MFCGKLKQQHQTALAKLAQAEGTVANLRNELVKAESERDAMRADSQQARLDGEMARLIFDSLQGFGVSFVALQNSQVAAAQSLKEETQHASEAASVSAGNREAVLQIAKSLEALSGDTL